MDRIEIEKATAEQLRQFGVSILGLELNGNETRAQVRGRFAEVGYNLPFITLQAEANPIPSGGPRDGAKIYNRRPGRDGVDEVRIVIHTQDKPGGDRAVQVSVNGKMMLIPRGEPVYVPEPYVHVLDNAEEYVYPEYDPETDILGGLKNRRAIKSYPFSFA